MELRDIKKISDYEWEIAPNTRPFMNVPVRIFASEAMLRNALKDRSIEQAMQAAALPGILQAVCVMPDVHQGYGFPIGGVAATDFADGVISPGARLLSLAPMQR